MKIPAINYYLKEPNTKDKSLLMICVGSGKDRMKFSTGVKLSPSHWDKVSQTINRKYTHSVALNHQLKKAITDIEGLYIGNTHNKPISKELIKKNVSLLNNGKEDNGDFFAAFDEYINSHKAKFTEGTIKVYYLTKTQIKKIEAEYNYPISFSSMNLNFYSHLIDHYVKGKEWLNSTFNRLIKTIKSFLTWATEKGLNTSSEYKKFKKLPEYEKDTIALTDEDLDKIRASPLNERLSVYRDWFLIECYTGLRFSDLKNIKKDSIKDWVITLTMSKQKTPISIPILPQIKDILPKYIDHNIKPPTNQKFNDALKEIGEQAGIDEVIRTVDYSGSKRIDGVFEKYEKITTHTGRRTFCTLAIKKGMPVHLIMKITGHKTEKAFRKYLRPETSDIIYALNNAFND